MEEGKRTTNWNIHSGWKTSVTVEKDFHTQWNSK